MDDVQLLELVKLKLGISTTLRDKPLEAILLAVKTELINQYGVKLDIERADHQIFVVDFVAYRYESKTDVMPRHLQWRLHNLQIASKEVENVE